MISCEVQFVDISESVVISFVYASNDADARRSLWNEISLLSTSPQIMWKAWSIIGDFNQVHSPSENSVSTSQNIDLHTRLFRQVLIESSIVDLNYGGSSFAWWNKQVLNPIAKKLDRILVNEEWIVLFPLALGFFGSPDFSDHASMKISLSSGQSRQKKPFWFFNYLLKNASFLPLVADRWFSLTADGSAMYRVVRKIKLLKPSIREFSK